MNTTTRKRFSIRNKLLIGFLCMFLVLIASIAVTLLQLSAVKNASKNLMQTEVPAFERVQRLKVQLAVTMGSLSGWLLTGNETFKEMGRDAWGYVDKDIPALDNYIDNWKDGSVRAQWSEVKGLMSQLSKFQIEISNNKNIKKPGVASDANVQNRNLPLILALTRTYQKIQNIMGALNLETGSGNGLSIKINRALREELNQINMNLNTIVLIEWILIAFSVVLAAAITWITTKSIVPPILESISIAKRITQGERDLEIVPQGRDETADLLEALGGMYKGMVNAENKAQESETRVQNILQMLQDRIRIYREHISLIANGDLREQLQMTEQDDLAKLGTHLNEMTDSLNKIAKQIVSASNNISVGLNELENTASAQAASAAQQATSVTEISSVVEEIKATSLQTLEKATKLGDSAELTQQESEKGRTAIDAMSSSMETLRDKMRQIADTVLGLSDKTQQISEITEAVSSLAKQSKMLALNAAIEAAKAGEAGKGFAVVAGEVKEFAEQSQQATERVQKILLDIRQTTERAVMSAEEGTKGVKASLEQVQKADDIITSLAQTIQESAVASQQIVGAVRQETAGIDQVVTSINEINKVTQQFSAATEQTKQASLNLGKIAQMLKENASVYRVKE